MLDGIINKIQSLCTPAFIFFVLSVLSLFVMLFDNLENTHHFCFGNVRCNVANTSTVFIVEILFIVFWTWVLNFICSRGYANVAWFILLFPYILLFALLLFSAAEIRNTNKQSELSVAIVDPFSFR
jgi:amino acid transporter